MTDQGGRRIASNKGEFATTRWSVVVSAGRSIEVGASDSQASKALAALCDDYWYPLYAFVRRRVSTVDEAQDLTQAFFLELLEKNVVASASPERGRFRAFLLTALKHFLSKQWDKSRAKKRGGGQPVASLDFEAADRRYRLEPVTDLTAEQLYDRQWAITMLDNTLRRLEAEFSLAGKTAEFEALRGSLVGDSAQPRYAVLAEQLEMSPDAVKMAVHRMRRRFRTLLRHEIAETIASSGDIDDEIRLLFAALESTAR